MRARIEYTIGSTLLLVGAFAIGAVVHGVFVERTIALTSPAAVLGIAGGIVLVLVGRSIEQRLKSSVRPTDDADGEDKEETFDEELVPFDPSMEKYERDDERE